jgi:hypothetical protein
MKKILILTALVGIIFAGCSDVKLNNVGPPDQGTYKLIPIPGKTGLSSETAYTTTKTIDGSVGDTMTINASYRGDNGHLVTLKLTMKIPAGAFSDVRTITLTADDQYAAVSCTPAMVFDKSLQLDYTYTGLDIKSLNLPKHTNGFYFISDSGNFEAIPSTGFLINKYSGTLSVTGAQINHFSRYGWTTLD